MQLITGAMMRATCQRPRSGTGGADAAVRQCTKLQNQFLFLILCCCTFKAKAATNDIASFTHKVSYLRYVIKRISRVEQCMTEWVMSLRQ
jgi:hypothetical protein